MTHSNLMSYKNFCLKLKSS